MLRPALVLAFATIAGVATAAPAPTKPADGFFRYPSIAGDTVVFAAEGDLWKVPAAGGTATRLTSYDGDERVPRLSSDGKWVAFSAEYQGNPDVYVMSTDGGEPKRLTFHPAGDLVIGWAPDGNILYRSRRDTPNGDYRVYKVSPQGGPSTLIPLEPAAWLSFEPKGKRVAMQKMGLEGHNWKRYKGGEAEDIEVGTIDPLAFKNVTSEWEGKDAFPMWSADGRIYFVSDRWGRPNLASMMPDGSDVKRLTKFDDYDVRWPSMNDGKIVYQHAMDLWVYDIASGDNKQIAIKLPSDRVQTRERAVDPMANRGSWAIAADGERIVLETRGDIFVTRTHKKGLIRRITASSASRTKDPAFSPDGKWIATWSEVDGEEQLVLWPSDNGGKPRQLGKVAPGWHYGPVWSPDGKKIAWSDQQHQVQVTDVASGKSKVIDKALWEIGDYKWSPDSRFLAYSVPSDALLGMVRVWDGAKVHDVSDKATNTFAPAWDPAGKYLYYLSDRTIDPYLDRFGAGRFVIDKATLPYVVSLDPATPLPFAARSDLDTAKDKDKADGDKPPGAGADKAGAAKKPPPPKPVKIVWDGIADRLVEVPVPPANYGALSAIEGKLIFLSLPNQGLMPPGGDDDDQGPQGADLLSYDLDKEKLSTITGGVQGYDLSMDHKVLVYQLKDGYFRIDASATSAPKPDPGNPDAMEDAHIDLSAWTLTINPREEWQQMLHEAWRLQRDFFYDSNMHGVDWKAVWKQYGSLAPRIASRDDLEDLLGEMLGELDVGHAYHFGGDLRHGQQLPTGLLAADLTQDAKTGFWRIDKIYKGDWPDAKMASPLARPDLRVTPGMWLVAIDGKPLTAGEDYLERLVGRAGAEVELSVNTKPSATGARRIVVKPVPSDQPIRYATWVRENRAYVDKQSGGKIGYIHLYDMGGLGLRQFARDFASQWQKQGLIVDDRWNHGGFVAPMIIAQLDRKLFAVSGNRYDAAPFGTTPDSQFHGHMAVLINRQGGSDCETFAQEIQTFKLAPVIGTRTWGGWVGIRGDKTLRDGGITTQPEFSGYDPTGKKWLIEGRGVDPDVKLDLDNDGLIHGNDKQLDYAIKDVLDRIAKDPRTLPPAPPIDPRPLKPVP